MATTIVKAKDITDLDSLKILLDEAGSKLVLIDFHAEWCGPCKMIAPFVEEMANTHSDNLIVLKCDVDDCSDVAQEYSISCMPTFVLIRNGIKIVDISGANKEKLQALVTSHI